MCDIVCAIGHSRPRGRRGAAGEVWRRCGGEEVLPERWWRRGADEEVVQEMLHDEGVGAFLILFGDDGRKGQ